ncbi:MAG TPA: septal ring lytic transglycosylase RlpA family protein [Solirubrobacteraceae bacterium]|jgi:rare lipoprotein A (peptidoglycan hydrolase)|nr:septal ring lytic transglycosylase RlpA family protein [Solirubrobacteraceae bacterium]
MHTAFFKHAVSAGLVAASLGIAAAPSIALASGSPAGGVAASSGGAASPSSGGAQPTPAGGAQSASQPSLSGGAAPSPAPSTKRALATWYGPGFYGHTTACGQKLTPKLVGLASRTLPCGTLVQISYRGRELTAPVLDRGPFAHNGAAWDLTSGAARALQITETVRIATQVVGSLPNAPSLGEPPSSSPFGEASQSPSAAGGGTTAG